MKYIRTKDGIYTGTNEEALLILTKRQKDIYLRHRDNKESFEEIAKDYALSPWTIRNIYGNARNRVNFHSKRLTDERKIIKQANTIEELCDEFAFICEDFNKPQLVIPMNFEYCKKTFKYIEIYGAIWADKGLIYVAKMNEKGELELL